MLGPRWPNGEASRAPVAGVWGITRPHLCGSAWGIGYPPGSIANQLRNSAVRLVCNGPARRRGSGPLPRGEVNGTMTAPGSDTTRASPRWHPAPGAAGLSREKLRRLAPSTPAPAWTAARGQDSPHVFTSDGRQARPRIRSGDHQTPCRSQWPCPARQSVPPDRLSRPGLWRGASSAGPTTRPESARSPCAGSSRRASPRSSPRSLVGRRSACRPNLGRATAAPRTRDA